MWARGKWRLSRRLGITSDLREGPAMALGSSELSLIELTGAYGAFGNGGLRIEPHAIRRVRLSSGRVLYARDTTPPQQAITPANVGAMNDMLNATLVSGTGKRAALAGPSRRRQDWKDVQDFRDAWFIGYTAQLTGGVWVGNDSATGMNKVMGGSLPARIWRDVMLAAHKGKAPLSLPGTTEANRETARAAPPGHRTREPAASACDRAANPRGCASATGATRASTVAEAACARVTDRAAFVAEVETGPAGPYGRGACRSASA